MRDRNVAEGAPLDGVRRRKVVLAVNDLHPAEVTDALAAASGRDRQTRAQDAAEQRPAPLARNRHAINFDGDKLGHSGMLVHALGSTKNRAAAAQSRRSLRIASSLPAV